MIRLLRLIFFLLVFVSLGSAQFVHTDHNQIVDAAGKPLLIRATNLGNWLVPEGYMWLFEGGPQSPSEIRSLVLELLGPEGSSEFWQKYRENYVTHEDVAFLHRAGFNAIRVPLHYGLFETDDADGFKLLDRLISCDGCPGRPGRGRRAASRRNVLPVRRAHSIRLGGGRTFP